MGGGPSAAFLPSTGDQPRPAKRTSRRFLDWCCSCTGATSSSPHPCEWKLGRRSLRWDRLRRLAFHFGAVRAWENVERLLAPGMKPLGSALTLSKDAALTGRIYVSAYGRRMDDYQELARALIGDSIAKELDQFAGCLLGEDRAYRTPTAVCSFGLGVGPETDFKFELCVHCLFSSDAEVSERLRSRFDSVCVDKADYLYMLELLSPGGQSRSAVELHTFAGIGVRNGERYLSVYLKPKLSSTWRPPTGTPWSDPPRLAWTISWLANRSMDPGRTGTCRQEDRQLGRRPMSVTSCTIFVGTCVRWRLGQS